MRVYYINANNGDGSSRTEFYADKECIDLLLDDDNPRSDDYQDGDGGSWGSFVLNGSISGVDIGTLETVRREIAEYGDY